MGSHADGPQSDVRRRRRAAARPDGSVESPPSDETFVAVVGTAEDGDVLADVASRLAADASVRDAVGSDERPTDERARYATWSRRRRLVVVTDRPSTVDFADSIYVVADGRVVEVGTHAELVRRRGTYARLYGDQFGQDWLRETADVADE